jgi:dephospho-CoA kinase
LAEIQRVFGGNIVSSNGHLRREALAQIVFADSVARKQLEDILHPRIREGWLAQLETWRSQNQSLAVVVIPLLFETRAESNFDKTVCVACSPVNQRQRLLERGWTPEQIQQRLAAQWPIAQKMTRADFIVWSDGSLESHAEQIERILAQW